ncbi:MAG: PLDc N-terminal domain-containing protein [Saprospiraceae bacterium]|nr:PLDc N-terminal domain-containing protein [Saprospiraceae bacterium]
MIHLQSILSLIINEISFDNSSTLIIWQSFQIFSIYLLWHIAKNKSDGKEQILWFLLVILAPIIGYMIYLFNNRLSPKKLG